MLRSSRARWTAALRFVVLPTAAAAALSSFGPSLRAQQVAGGTAQILTADDVLAVIRTAAQALSDDTMAVAVVDRAGTILGVYRRSQADARTPDIAVSLARTTGYFSNDQAPLSSRTVRFISGIHFPPGIANQPNAALYGVENINRGCDLDVRGDAIFNFPIDRPRSIAGTFGAAGTTGLPCRPSDTRGCAVGGPIRGENGQLIFSQGITTGKVDLRDTNNGAEETINPGGIPLYRGGKLIGGVGVAGVSRDRAEFAALVAAAANGRGITTAIDFPQPLPVPGAIFIDGLRLPFTEAAADRRPAGSSPGDFLQGTLVVTPRNGRQAPEGYLIGPRASSQPGGLTLADVQQIVNQAVAQAAATRAQVRLPLGQQASFIIAITDQVGDILAEFRNVDSLFDAVDVVPAKARNAYYFSTREGYEVLRGFVNAAPYEDYSWEPEPPAGRGWALTSRTLELRRTAPLPARHRPRASADAGTLVRPVRLRHAQSVHGGPGPQPRRQPRVPQPERDHVVPRERAPLQGRPARRRNRGQRRRHRAERPGDRGGREGVRAAGGAESGQQRDPDAERRDGAPPVPEVPAQPGPRVAPCAGCAASPSSWPS